jgi:hypothetical protein
MSSSTTDFMFNNLGGIRADIVDQSERNMQNTRLSNYMLSNFSADALPANFALNFATSQPTMVMTGLSKGSGLDGNIVDIDSLLTVSKEQARALEKLELQQRPFLTVPYLGRGSCDPVLESQLQQGELVHDKKSVSTIMEKSFQDYSSLVLDSNMESRVTDTQYTVQESALNGWVRGGVNTRTTGTSGDSK